MQRKRLNVRKDCKDPYLNYAFRNARLNAGHTYYSLAEKLGVSYSMISEYERLRRFPLKHRAKKLAKILKVSVEEIFSEKTREITQELYVLRTCEEQALVPLHRSTARNLEAKTSQSCTLDEEFYSALSKALSTLPQRKRHILERRFGLNGFEPATLEYIGKEQGLSHQMVRQIEIKALEYLRHPVRSRSLEVFLE
ncbi:helix-turn-helix domain-containing protein [Candidatus Woesearchaeota archaeon]|nr:helix-turn-helix domain-containing protein [Candidatus Woesearchaeota archaeon]